MATEPKMRTIIVPKGRGVLKNAEIRAAVKSLKTKTPIKKTKSSGKPLKIKYLGELLFK
jgi:hypothetical protein